VVNGQHLQLRGAEPGHWVGEIAALGGELVKRLSIATGSLERDALELGIGRLVLQPMNLYAPVGLAIMDKLQGGFVFFAGVAEADYGVSRQAIILLQYQPQHVGRCAPTRE
jgi:hypothetical protein